MSDYVKCDLGDGTTLLVEAVDGDAGGQIIDATRGFEGAVVHKFGEALKSVKASAAALRRELAELSADEVEVKFVLKTTGEFGLFAMGKLGAEANYELTLKWKAKGNAG
jgi:hypothetical protein